MWPFSNRKHIQIDYNSQFKHIKDLESIVDELKQENKELHQQISEKINKCKYVYKCNHTDCDIHSIRERITEVKTEVKNEEFEQAIIRIKELEERLNSILRKHGNHLYN